MATPPPLRLNPLAALTPCQQTSKAMCLLEQQLPPRYEGPAAWSGTLWRKGLNDPPLWLRQGKQVLQSGAWTVPIACGWQEHGADSEQAEAASPAYRCGLVIWGCSLEDLKMPHPRRCGAAS